MLRPLSWNALRGVVLLALLASIALAVASRPDGAGPANGAEHLSAGELRI